MSGMTSLTSQRQSLAQTAMQKSIEIRNKMGLALNTPICIYDLCDKLNVTVRFVDYNMEGMYVKDRTLILLSALRPVPRRNFTCAHELGHHVFGHGTTVDELIEDLETPKIFQPNEFLVDSFAGFLLMPTLGIRKAFASRNWNSASATPQQIFTIACSFGVGYKTLIDHLTYSLKMLTAAQAKLLLKSKPKTIREEILGRSSTESLIIADEHWSLPIINAEVGSLLLLPSTAEAAKTTISLEEDSPKGRLFRANRPGIVRVCCPNTEWAVFVRISHYQFVGLSKYRHLEETNDEQ
jgi:Zn-dependent peptidase ImmA (M78 family)